MSGLIDLYNRLVADEDLDFDDDLDLSDMAIVALPEGITARDVILNGTEVPFPARLTARRDLYLFNTKIRDLPSDVQVGGKIYLPDGMDYSSVEEARAALNALRSDEEPETGFEPEEP